MRCVILEEEIFTWEVQRESSTNRCICNHPASRKRTVNFDSLFQPWDARKEGLSGEEMETML